MSWRLHRGSRLFLAVIGVIAAIVLADLLAPPPIERAGDQSTIVTDANGQWLHAFANDQQRWRFEAHLDEIDPAFIERLILIEDKRFWGHPGVDPVAAMRAAFTSAKAGRVVSGASTISMQTARLLEPRPRNLGSKFVEMVRALQLERRLSKREILELYLTLAPYGGNIEGVRAASIFYFDKEPGRLTDAEQALLIALPQAPEARRPDRRQKNAVGARREILKRLASLDAIGATAAAEADEASLPGQRASQPRLAYHVAERLARTEPDAIITSTIDAQLQAAAEAMTLRYAAQFDDGATASLLVIENQTRAVRASVGSSSLDAPGGWIDLTGASRSPGSTLKPFIYALALEDGLISASTVIEDMPRSFGGYSPENFDRTFRGEVRVREALQHSLNVPAVATLSMIGATRFSSLMNAAGVSLKTKETADKKPGLALALGGAGVTAQEIAALYAGLGDDGLVRPLVWTEEHQNAENNDGYRLMSSSTAARISTILAGAPSLEGRAPAHLSQTAPSVAFKTGTSYGYRDAWSAGHDGAYTVVVWVGRADGGVRPGATGRKVAAPLLFDVFDMLEAFRKGDGGRRIDQYEQETPAPAADTQTRFGIAAARARPPEIVFPRDGVELFVDGKKKGRGFALAARGGGAGYRWYVNGDPIRTEEASRRVVWRPSQAGFHEVTVVDGAGRAATSKVRVFLEG